MAEVTKSLADLRREIDDIDRQLHELLMARTRVVEQVTELKRDQAVKIRPAREAEIIYRLVDNHQGAFPKRELVRIWREIIVATLRMEGPFSVAVCMPEDMPGYWDLARDQFGSFAPMTQHGSVRRVIDAVMRGESTIGILPIPESGEADPWWRHLVAEDARMPRIIARLPFAGPGNSRGGELEALAVAAVPQEPTGRDRSFLALDVEEDLGLRRLRAAMDEADLTPVMMSAWHDEQKPEVWLHCLEIEGFVAADDKRIGRMMEAIGPSAKRLISLGGYAKPLQADSLGVDPGVPSETLSKPKARST